MNQDPLGSQGQICYVHFFESQPLISKSKIGILHINVSFSKYSKYRKKHVNY